MEEYNGREQKFKLMIDNNKHVYDTVWKTKSVT